MPRAFESGRVVVWGSVWTLVWGAVTNCRDGVGGRQMWCATGLRTAAAILAVQLPICVSAYADDSGPNADGVTVPSIATSLPSGSDPGGARRSLAERGLTYNFYYTNDILANLAGGLRRGVIDQGKLEGSLAVDLGKAMGLTGLSFFSNAFQIHNTGRIRRDYVGGLNTIAAIEAVPATRLSELWLEQKFLAGKASLRVGQLAADTEFFFSDLSTLFLQSDWPTIAAANMPSGGPAYPLSTPGVRLKYAPAEGVTALVAVFNGDPAGPGTGDEQSRNSSGLNFRVGDPPLVMGELQLKTDGGANGLSRTVKVGGWTHFGTFADQRIASDGRLLADPDSSQEALKHKQTGGVYAILDQQVYRPKGGAADSGVSFYTRVSASPSDRSLIDFHADGGIVVAGLVPSRPDDKFGVSVIYARFSDAARGFDRDTSSFGGTPGVVRDFETNLEVIYQAQIVPGWVVQPDWQYIWHPSGDASRDAMVTGVRSYWHY